jgi:hypothetical protein
MASYRTGSRLVPVIHACAHHLQVVAPPYVVYFAFALLYGVVSTDSGVSMQSWYLTCLRSSAT